MGHCRFCDMVEGVKLPTLRRGHTHEWLDKNRPLLMEMALRKESQNMDCGP
jgi:hypothetical protein